MSVGKKQDVLNPQMALASYLDALLRTGTEAVQVATKPVAPVMLPEESAEVVARLAEAPEMDRGFLERRMTTSVKAAMAPPTSLIDRPRTLLPPVMPVAPAPVAEPVVPDVVPHTVPVEPVAVPVVPVTVPEVAVVNDADALVHTGWKDGRPEWASGQFEVLIFSVSGLKLAVPLILLGGVHRIEQDLTQIPGRPDWFMGLLPTSERNIRVVDTARWVMGNRYPEDAGSRYRFIIRLAGSDWGLACDEVAESCRLQPSAVKWRSEASRRPWLAGTLIDQMCALMDAGTLSDLLSRAEKDKHLDLDSPITARSPKAR